MKKRSLVKSKKYRIINYEREFYNFGESFFYARLILALFIFIIYFSFSFDGIREGMLLNGGSDFLLFGVLFAYIAYMSSFNLIRFLFCVMHGVYPLYFGGFSNKNGWLKFDYKDWEMRGANYTGYFATLVYDMAVFLVTISFITIITIRLL